MSGIPFCWNALGTMRMVTASSIFGESSYYMDGYHSEMRIKDAFMKMNPLFAEYAVATLKAFDGISITQEMEKTIDDALDYDFRSTLEWAVNLRKEYCMRLNPKGIMVRTATHPKRQTFTAAPPPAFR